MWILFQSSCVLFRPPIDGVNPRAVDSTDYTMTRSSTVLVTGGSGSIGRAVALSFAQAGFDVAVAYHRNNDGARKTATTVEDHGQRATVMQADISNREAAAAVVEQAGDLGPLSVVVNAAGTIDPGPIEDAPATIRQLLAVNVEGAINVTTPAVERLRRRNGSVVNVVSAAAVCGTVDTTYATSKAGLLGFTRALAREVGQDGIRVNAVAPGPVDTPMNDAITESLEDRRYRGHHTVETLLDRYEATPEEVASAIRFLAIHEFITGEVLHVDGGMALG
jgi:3-oxoacyl-[acyl-carrier protein] reductase